MEYNHNIIDDDPHFVIDADTRAISYASEKNPVLVCGDHNSERFTFELPKVIDGHEMIACDAVQVHYINVDGSGTVEPSVGAYEVQDKQLSDDGEKMIFSWLISQTATTYAGTLSFAVKFICRAENGSTEYVWNTIPYVGVTISSGIDNDEIIVEEYYDVLETWYNQLVTAGSNSIEAINDVKESGVKAVEEAKNKALSEFDAQVKESFDARVEQLKETITVDMLNYHDLIAQERGYDPNKMISQEATTKVLDAFESDLATKTVEAVNEARAIASDLEERLLDAVPSTKYVVDSLSRCKITVGLLEHTDFKVYIAPVGGVISWNVKFRISCMGIEYDRAVSIDDSSIFDALAGHGVLINDVNFFLSSGTVPIVTYTVNGNPHSLMFAEFTENSGYDAFDDYSLYLVNVDKVYRINTPDSYTVNANSIEDITKTSTAGNVDTYTISLTDGQTKTFTVTNGNSASGDFPFQDYNVPTVYLDGDITGMSKDDAVTLDYRYGDRSGTCTLKWQGSSSIAYPKKNYTVKFDNAFEAVSGWGVQKKYVLKADWVDFSHCRNVVSAKLWGDVVRSRATSDLVTRLSALPNCGAIDGFPCFVVINGEWQGIFNFNIPKDGWMMGMGSGTKEAILCCEGTGESDASAFKAEATLGVEFELEYSSDGWAESDIQNSLNTLIRAVMNSDGTDIDTTIAQYLDIDSAIDYMLFSQLLGHHDGNYKNYILATYDGTKWFLSAYDMDNVFGFHFPGSNVDSASLGTLWCLGNKLFDLLYNHKFEALHSRLNELLTKKHTVQGVGNFYDGVMSLAQVTEKLTDYGLRIPLPAYVADAEKWNVIPSTYLNNVPQAVSWYGQRVDVLTKQYKEPEVYRGTKGIRYSTLYATCYGTGGSYVDIDIILPSEPTVYAIAGNAFTNNTFIESVVVPNNYKTIGSSAFSGCTSLRKIDLPDTITTLGWGVFQGCSSLKGVRLPNSLTAIDNNIFRNCTSLSRVHLSKIPKLTNNFFESCTALTDIYYDGTMTEWNALPKGSGWNTNTGTYTIHCTDGDVAKA